MGGVPLLALSIAAFPEELPTALLGEILAGADAQVRAAGALLAGGHTIRDAEPKYGLAVVGTVHPEGIWPKNGARPGDALYLTKPLGTGLVLHGLRKGLTGEAELAEAVRWMRTLNAAAADALRPLEPSAVTDVTGFGLLGHGWEVAERSGARLELDADALPLYPGALGAAEAGIRTGGDPRNRSHLAGKVSSSAPAAIEALAYDPQTSGGLLAAVPESEAANLLLAEAGFVPIGHVSAGPPSVHLT